MTLCVNHPWQVSLWLPIWCCLKGREFPQQTKPHNESTSHETPLVMCPTLWQPFNSFQLGWILALWVFTYLSYKAVPWIYLIFLILRITDPTIPIGWKCVDGGTTLPLVWIPVTIACWMATCQMLISMQQSWGCCDTYYKWIHDPNSRSYIIFVSSLILSADAPCCPCNCTMLYYFSICVTHANPYHTVFISRLCHGAIHVNTWARCASCTISVVSMCCLTLWSMLGVITLDVIPLLSIIQTRPASYFYLPIPIIDHVVIIYYHISDLPVY